MLPDTETCWALLERIASSAPLKYSRRLQDLLLYIGRRSLLDGCKRIHEQEIGTRIFHRPDSYDTNSDNIVRTNVSALRKRIETYFRYEGAHESLHMEIPRGSYVPVFHYRTAEQATTEDSPDGVEPHLATTGRWIHAHPLWVPAALVLAGALIVLLAAGCLYYRSQYEALHGTLYKWQSDPAVAAFWSQFLNANPATDVVMSDTGIGLAEALSRKTFPLNDYLNRSYTNQIQSEDLSPDMHAAIGRILSWNLANPDEFTLARRIMALDPLGKGIRLYNARNYLPDFIKRDNVILIGARRTNPWDELFDDQMNFISNFESPRVINRVPASGELPVYFQTDSDGYCVVAYMPNADHSGHVLLIEGTNAEATEAGGDFLFSNDQLSSLQKRWHGDRFPYFQVLLKVSAVRGTPLSAMVVAYRPHPDAH